MQRFLIITTNCALLVLLLIDCRRRRESILATSTFVCFDRTGADVLRIGIAVAANILAALIFIKGRKQKILCWEWTAIFCALLLAYYGFTRGWFNFEWLKQALLWLQKHFEADPSHCVSIAYFGFSKQR